MPKRTGNPFPFDPFRDLPPGRLFDAFRDITTRQELRQTCELLRERLAPANDTRIAATYYSRLMLRALWVAMKRIGDGDVPSWPKPLNRDTYSALFKNAKHSLEPERLYFEARRRVLDAIAVVERWCEDAVTVPAAKPPMTPDQRLVFELLQKLPAGEAMTGSEIIGALIKEKHIHQGSLTSRIIPFLKEHYGVRSKRGAGYYVEQNER
jgi:hypothetical protein